MVILAAAVITFHVVKFTVTSTTAPMERPSSYFSHQAHSFVQGRLDIATLSPKTHDISVYKGKVFAYWPPLASIIYAPAVNLRGHPFDFPQRRFALLFAALNAAIFATLGWQVFSQLPPMGRMVSSLGAGVAFGLGTSNAVFAGIANDWFVGQLYASTFTLLAIVSAYRFKAGRQLSFLVLASVCFSIAVLGRAHLALGVGFLLLLCKRPREVLSVLAPLSVSIGILAWYNYARFDSVFEFGIHYQNMRRVSRQLTDTIGLSDVSFVLRNFYINVLRLPFFGRFDGYDVREGFGLFFQCPILVLALARSPKDTFERLLLIASIPVACFVLTWVGSGREQFGARYLYDAVPFLAALALVNYNQLQWHHKRSISVGLVVLSISIQCYGIKWWLR